MSLKEQFLKILLGDNTDNVNTVTCENKGCGSTDIKSWEQQTRSSDEPITIFHKCRKCGYVSIDSGS